MIITVIIDNNGTAELAGEWGLCLYIEYQEKKILYDTGRTGLLLSNAAALGIDLSSVDYGVLSHAHHDHGNGIPFFLSVNDHAPLYLQEPCIRKYYGGWGAERHYIGLPVGVPENCMDRVQLVKGKKELSPGICLVPHEEELSSVGRRNRLYVLKDGRYHVDDLSHEQSLVFDTPKGLVIFNGCCHGGADRIIREAMNAFPGRKPYAVIGGFHLFTKTEKEVRALARSIRETGITRVITGHCTGEVAYAALAEELGERLEALSVGRKFVL